MMRYYLEEPRQCRCCIYTTLLNRAADIDAETYVSCEKLQRDNIRTSIGPAFGTHEYL